MSVSISVVDDEPDFAELFHQRFRREARDGTYVMHFANSGEGALQPLGEGIERPCHGNEPRVKYRKGRSGFMQRRRRPAIALPLRF